MEIKIKLLELMAQNEIRHVATLAKKADVSDQTLNNLIKGNSKTLRLDTIGKVCKALNCTIDELIVIKYDKEEVK